MDPPASLKAIEVAAIGPRLTAAMLLANTGAILLRID